MQRISFRRAMLALNKDLIERVLHIAQALGRKPYTHIETRDLLGLKR